MRPPQLWVLAGPNGAGKSTLAARYNRGRLPIVNPDVLFAEDPSLGLIGAGRMALKQQAAHLEARTSFIVETTFSGNRELGLMKSARASGFKVNLVFVGLKEAGSSVLRVRDRVAAGGHDVPVADILRRRERSLANLAPGADSADRTIVFDNSGRRPLMILLQDKGRLRQVARSIPGWLTPRLPNAWTH